MWSKIVEWFTGQDDLERIANRNDPRRLNDFLKTRTILFPIRPNVMYDADQSLSEDEIRKMVDEGARTISTNDFDLWVLTTDDGKRRLPAFSSEQKLEVFGSKMSQLTHKVFPLACVGLLLADVIRSIDVDFVELNALNPRSWEIGTARPVDRTR